MKNCTNTGSKVAMVTRFCTVAPNICGSSATVLAPRIWRLILDFFENLCIPVTALKKKYFKYGLLG
jgi:hypothetical protein